MSSKESEDKEIISCFPTLNGTFCDLHFRKTWKWGQAWQGKCWLQAFRTIKKQQDRSGTSFNQLAEKCLLGLLRWLAIRSKQWKSPFMSVGNFFVAFGSLVKFSLIMGCLLCGGKSDICKAYFNSVKNKKLRVQNFYSFAQGGEKISPKTFLSLRPCYPIQRQCFLWGVTY